MSLYDNQFRSYVDHPMIFFARVINIETGASPQPADIQTIRYTVWPLGPLDGRRREPILGHRQVTVPNTAFSAELQASAAFPDGFNFRHAPDVRTRSLFPEVGRYEVCFTLTLTDGNPILLSYRVTVE